MFAIFASFVVGGVVGVGAHFGSLMFYPLYTSEVLFELQPGVQDPTKVGSVDINKDDLIERLARTQAVLIVSRDVLVRAMENPTIQRATEWHKYFLDDNGIFDIEEAVDELEEDLRTPILRGTNLFALRWSAHDRNDIPVVLNAIKKTYLDKRKALDEDSIIENNKVFTGRLSQTDAALRDLTSSMQIFIIEHGLSTLQDPGFSNESKALDEINEQITENSAMLNRARSAYAQVQLKLEGTLEPSFDNIQEAESDPLIMQRISEVDVANTALRALEKKYQLDHHEVVAGRRRVRAAEDERDQRLAQTILRNLEAQRSLLTDEIESLEILLEQIQLEAEQKDALLRERAADYSEYQAMVTEREQLEEARKSNQKLIDELTLMRLRVDANRVRVAQEPLAPRKPSFPEPEIVIPLGVLLCMGLTIAFIFYRELTDTRIKSMSDLEVLPGTTVLGSIPDLEDDPTRSKSADLVVSRHPNSVLAESYRQTCANICLAIDRNDYQTIAFVGGLPGAGATTALTNIALVLAATGKKVLVVDADFRRPRLAKSLGVAENASGLGDLLVDAITLEEAIVETENGISVLPAGTMPNRIIERLSSSKLTEIVSHLRNRFDIVLFDTPPSVVAGDALSISSRVDCVILVVRANREERGLVTRLIRQFENGQSALIGLLLNRPTGTAGGYFKKNYAVMVKYGLDKDG